MRLIIIAVGHRMPAWVDAGFQEYAHRMPAELRIELREIKPEARTSGRSVEQLIALEGQRLQAALPKRAQIIALDERGQDCSTLQLAQHLQGWRDRGDDVVLLIGGPDGLAATLKAQATLRLRLSSLTLPHGMVRVLLAEQLYRAWSLSTNHPYHRA